MNEITTYQYNGYTCYETVARGVQYTVRFVRDRWEVHSHRLALGRSNIGSFRHFDTVEEMAAKIKSLSGMVDLINMETKGTA